MKYIFEDKESDYLSKLFRGAYPNSVTRNFCYSNGNGQLVSKTISFLDNEDLLFVFLDTVPANSDIILIYEELCDISRDNNFKVIVFPIVCAEYYFIKSISNYEHIVVDNDTVRLCVNKEFFFDCDLLLKDSKSASFARNFERFCKIVMKNKSVLASCLHLQENGEIKFFNSDCLCDCYIDSCINISLRQKSLNFVKEYPCFPSGSYLNENLCNKDDIINIHRMLVDEFNAWVDSYKSIDVTARKYRHIKYLL